MAGNVVQFRLSDSEIAFLQSKQAAAHGQNLSAVAKKLLQEKIAAEIEAGKKK